MNASNEMILIYSTFSSKQKALEASQKLIEEKLIACANILPEMTSVYRWKEKIENSNEIVTLFKTQSNNFEKVSSWLNEHHDYECPCVIQIPITAVSSQYLSWLKENLK